MSIAAAHYELPPLSAEFERDAARAADPVIVLIVGLLMSIGVVMVYSASVRLETPALPWPQWWNSPLRQGVFSLVGFVVLIVVARVDHRIWAWQRPGDSTWSGTMLVLAIALLALVLVPGIGQTGNGARRALGIPGAGGLSFQPSELAKVALCIWLAAFLTRPQFDVRAGALGFFAALASAGALIGLTGIEDFGTAALLGVVTLGVLFVANARLRYLAVTVVMGAAAGAVLLLSKSYRRERLMAFFSEKSDPSAEGYQVTQALIAITSGGWLGRGLGEGIQKYGYLPQDNNDFIFAIVCEELGIVGGLIVVALFLALLLRGWWIVRHADGAFDRLLAAGVTLTLCSQAAINLAVVTELVPTKGISLPFVSSGGSGVIFLGCAAGLLASVGGRAMVAAQRR